MEQQAEQIRAKLSNIIENEMKNTATKKLLKEILFGHGHIHDYYWAVEIGEIIKQHMPEQAEEINAILKNNQ